MPADPLDLVLGGDHVITGQHDDAKAKTLLDAADHVPLVVQNIEGDIAIHRNAKLVHLALHRFILDHAKHLQCRGLDRPDPAGALAMRAHRCDRFIEAEAKPLARHLEKAEMADRPDLDAGAVIAHGILHPTFDSLLVAVFLHIDEVDHNQAGQVAKTELAGQFVGSFQVRLQRGFLDVALARRPPRVDVDGDKRLGLVDHQIAPRFQRHLRAVDGVHLLLDLIALENRLLFLVFLNPLDVARDQHLHLLAGFLVALLALYDHLVNLAGIEVADGALDQVTFLMDQAWCLGFQCFRADFIP